MFDHRYKAEFVLKFFKTKLAHIFFKSLWTYLGSPDHIYLKQLIKVWISMNIFMNIKTHAVSNLLENYNIDLCLLIDI